MHKKVYFIFLVILTLFIGISSSPENSKEFPIFKTDQEITIDGILSEAVWKKFRQLTGFRQNKPTFGEPVSLETTMMAVYDNRMLYFAFECQDPQTEKISGTSARDGAIGNDDSIVILLDTLNDKSNAYLFGVNALGTQFDLKMIENGKSWDLAWNGNWLVVCKINQGNWVAEIGIPFDEIAFDKNIKSMGFNAIRNIPRNEEEAFLILNQSNPWDISKFGLISNFDLSHIEANNYEKNLTAYKNEIEKIKENYLKSDEYFVEENLFYKRDVNLSSYEKERCFLDLYLPKNLTNFPVMIWFYGGSLERGSKDDSHTQDLAKHFAGRGLAVAVVDYRLFPRVKYPAYIEDAAASVAWVTKHIKDYNGNPGAIFIGGHSAGGYLTYILGMDRRYLGAAGVEIDRIAGLIPISGQTFTHYAIRAERGIPDPQNTPIIDEASPCYHAQKSGPPILAICGDKDPQDRIEENHYFLALLNKIGYPNVTYFEAQDRTHWELVFKIPTRDDPVSKNILDFISKRSQLNE